MFKRLFGSKKSEEIKKAPEQTEDSESNSPESSNEWPLLEDVLSVFDVVRLIAEDAEGMYDGEIRDHAWEGIDDDVGIKPRVEALIPPEYDQTIDAYYSRSEPDEKQLRTCLDEIKANTSDTFYEEILASFTGCLDEYLENLDLFGMLDVEFGNDDTEFRWAQEVYTEVLGEDDEDTPFSDLDEEQRQKVFDAILVRYSQITDETKELLISMNEPRFASAIKTLAQWSQQLNG